ncbi:MAG: M23 family metallopeptidase [Deltaproteobacteria bacterium]|nr:M23 family metallopeptidase [Deltaproteobacteria bacterium]
MKRLTFPTILLWILGVFLGSCGSPYGIYHRVEKGESLHRIAKTYGVSPEELALMNELKDPSNLHVGQKIFIPGASYPKKVGPARGKGDPEEEAYRHPEKVRDTVTRGMFIWPVKGRISSYFGKRGDGRHDGIDIVASEGKPIVASAAGEILYSDNKIRGYGNLIIIRHKGYFATVYAHNKVNLGKRGEKVKAGQTVARIGQTGRASGPHLHFEVRKANKPVDPLLYLKK